MKDSAKLNPSSLTLSFPKFNLEFLAAQGSNSDQISIGAVNDGYAMLQEIDPNTDGRFSIRELRQLNERLAAFDRNSDGQITSDETHPTFRVCIGLGPTAHQPLALLREVNAPIATTQVTGPEWFTEMDKNKNYDLTRQEFPGTDEQFKQLDADSDELISTDEINRTPPKTQSALLEAMQERQLTVCGKTYKLPDPFFVLATQNPVETEGTYPLPEAQLDRFLLKIHVKYPSRVEELEIARRQTTDYSFTTKTVLEIDHMHAMQSIVRNVVVADHVYEAALDLVRGTRPDEGSMAPELQSLVQWGRGAAGDDRAAAGRQGARVAESSMSCNDGRSDGRCSAGAAASCDSDVQRQSPLLVLRWGIRRN